MYKVTTVYSASHFGKPAFHVMFWSNNQDAGFWLKAHIGANTGRAPRCNIDMVFREFVLQAPAKEVIEDLRARVDCAIGNWDN